MSRTAIADVRTAPRHARSALLVAGLLAVTSACGSSGGDDATETTAKATTTTTTEAPATAAADLEAILPAADEFGNGFAEAEPQEVPPYLRSAMVERCPGAARVTETPDDAVAMRYVAPDGRQISLELTPGSEPMAADEEAEFLDALNECEVAIDVDGVTHSLVWSGGSDAIGDQAVRGALADSMSSADQPEPVGVVTYFARIVVGDVALLIRGTDGFVGNQRVEFNPDDLAAIAQEMVARTEELTASPSPTETETETETGTETEAEADEPGN